eukprot:gene11004-12252_t
MLRQSVRGLSTKVQRTPEEVKAALERGERFKKFVQQSVQPTTITQGLGSGKDLYIPKDLSEMAVLSGMPVEQAQRTVIIAPRLLKSLQSGGKYANQWQITWPNQARWSNGLMGWTGTSDPMSNVKLHFDSKEEAIAFAQRNGWKYNLQRPTAQRTTPLGTNLYKHNFLDKRTMEQMKKEGPSTKIWEAPTYGESHWFMPLKYHGDGVVTQHGPKPAAN